MLLVPGSELFLVHCLKKRSFLPRLALTYDANGCDPPSVAVRGKMSGASAESYTDESYGVPRKREGKDGANGAGRGGAHRQVGQSVSHPVRNGLRIPRGALSVEP